MTAYTRQDGATGLDPTYPNLAGQSERYLVHQLIAIRDGGREIALMAGQLNGKSDQDLADMARYGARAFLIGESLMRQEDVAAATKALLANPLVAVR